MRTGFVISLPMIAIALISLAGLREEEKAFLDKYKKAFESGDKTALASFLYTSGSDPGIVEFYKLKQSAEAGRKMAKIELIALTAEELKRGTEPQQSPRGGKGKVCLPLKPIKKLVITLEATQAGTKSPSKTENLVAEKDGGLVIPVPGPCK